MKTSRIAAVAGLAAALAFAPALSAGAAPVSSDVTPDHWIDLTTENFFSDFAPITEAGPATFPLTIPSSGVLFRASGLAVSTPENCERVVDEITITFGTDGPVVNQTGVGSSATLALVPDFDYTYEGDGVATLEADFLEITFEPEAEQTGTLRITLGEPVPADEAFLVVGFYSSPEVDFVIESASFAVTDDCTAAAPVAPAAPTLAATGTDVAPIVGAGAALLVLGAAATVIAARRPQL
ncbi:hypothetical protein M2152_002624 [Microbacteriaceae bacterium SG_E_30_P1]|uniref:LPXTG-motif cell wall anchor domain-containing protein n=1 Tax=Antiquaquibacter oligotrophicus TaxID=2880260 RepID=A0ABT6KTN1_9MICO|nr:hypothetical protein [Antiquaquibacter oligotrophicus]MDH6182442.1 hypothetical protein [Antiquaquibacter oligotrophicus]UDF14587.1 hypothetical protein LH407_06925 [Antiquaquibacter oligotrophicus]